MASALDQKEYLTRKECSSFLKEIGVALSVGRLANLASNNNVGGGPPFYRTRWSRVYYRKEEVKAWADGQTERVP